MNSVNPSFTHAILHWFAANGRELPWRGTRNPYAIWLSEVILQQTRIAQGRDYWERFMRQWPTVEALAAAPEDDVLRAWQGLGYYSRARNLHFAARQVVEMGGFPDTFEELKRLKGVGDYTAAAIASIAFDRAVAVVDGNVFRVLSRYFGIDTPINSTEGKKIFTALANELLPTDRASEFNQAMMDFGAIQCTPHLRSGEKGNKSGGNGCECCPLMESCVAFREQRVESLPVKAKTVQVKERHMDYIYIRCNGETAFRKRGAGDIWQGLWEPLLWKDDGAKDTIELNIPSHLPRPLGKEVKHVLTHRVLLARFFLWETAEKPTLPQGYEWIKETEIDRYGIPRLIEMLVERVQKLSSNDLFGLY